jgi:hypothetical protein
MITLNNTTFDNIGSTQEYTLPDSLQVPNILQSIVLKNRQYQDVYFSNNNFYVYTSPASYNGSFGSHGVILMADGRVYSIAYGVNTSRIYDPITNTVITPSGTFTTNNYLGGVCLNNGQLLIIPSSPSATVKMKLYDPATNTLLPDVNPVNDSLPTGTDLFFGGIKLKDGRVFLIPFNSTTARIYDPINNTLFTPKPTFPGNYAFRGGVLLPDGRVFLVPSNATKAYIYNPYNDTVFISTPNFPGGGAFAGGVLLPDGRVFLVPNYSTLAWIYNPITDTIQIASGSYPGGDAYRGGVLMSDGRVFLVPFNTTQAVIYDPITNTRTTRFFVNGLANGVLLPDGRIFCNPVNQTQARIVAPSSSRISNNNPHQFPLTLLLSGHLSHY